MFEVNGVMVNHAGEPVDQDGRVIKAEQPVAVESPDAQALREARADLEGERQESARLTAQLAEADQLAARVVELEAQLQTMTGYRDAAANDAKTRASRVSELEAQLAGHSDGENAKPGDVDQRTKAQLKEALDGKGVAYAPSTNRDGLLALAAEHQV